MNTVRYENLHAPRAGPQSCHGAELSELFERRINLRADLENEEREIMVEQGKPEDVNSTEPEAEPKEEPRASTPVTLDAPPLPPLEDEETQPGVETEQIVNEGGVHIFDSGPVAKLVPIARQGNFLANGSEDATRKLENLMGELIDNGLKPWASGIGWDNGRWQWAFYGVIPEMVNAAIIPFEATINDKTMATEEKIAAARAEIAAELVMPAAVNE